MNTNPEILNAIVELGLIAEMSPDPEYYLNKYIEDNDEILTASQITTVLSQSILNSPKTVKHQLETAYNMVCNTTT